MNKIKVIIKVKSVKKTKEFRVYLAQIAHYVKQLNGCEVELLCVGSRMVLDMECEISLLKEYLNVLILIEPEASIGLNFREKINYSELESEFPMIKMKIHDYFIIKVILASLVGICLSILALKN